MATFSIVTFLVALRLLLLVSAAPAPVPIPAAANVAASSYWLSSITRQGAPAFGPGGFKVFRNVMDYGAKGDGVTDDTVAINKAVSDGSRCGQGCDSTTVTPALVYFPPGTYVVSAPIIQYYYTQFVGDAVTVPTIKASASFAGMAVIDADPYADGGVNWFTNQVSRVTTN
jgi:glucan 1,3-beta-glucosidase